MAVFIGAMKKDPCWRGYEMIGTKRKGKRIVPNCVPIGAIGSSESDREQFYKMYDNLSKSDKLALEKELVKEIQKVDDMKWFRIPDDKKAKQIYRQKMIEARKRAYKKFGIKYVASFLPK